MSPLDLPHPGNSRQTRAETRQSQIELRAQEARAIAPMVARRQLIEIPPIAITTG